MPQPIFSRYTILLLAFQLFLAFKITAQISTNEIPLGIIEGINPDKIKEQVVEFDVSKNFLNNQRDKTPNFAGFSIAASIPFSKKASPLKLETGAILWHLKITVPGARFLGIVFSSFSIAPNDKFFIYTADKNYHIGAFTNSNNSDDGYFSTHILPSSTLILEYYSQNGEAPPDFWVDEMIYIFDDELIGGNIENLKNSGTCNVNINCPEGNEWQKQKRGIARILLRSGSSWFNCTGTLINTTASNGTPYFLTADHCGPNASTADLAVWQFYFNYEYSSCTNVGIAPQNMMLSGAQLISKAPIQGGTDFKLLLLNDPPLKIWNPYYNGWTRSSRNPERGVTIHHPAGDVKKISTFTSPLTDATFTGGMALGYWRVIWAETVSGNGITEGGSSGAPLFETNGLVTGTLTGGSATCNTLLLPDFYGKFSMHWSANGETNDKMLKPWLDPNNTNPESVFGYDPNNPANFVITVVDPPLSGNVAGAGYFIKNEKVTLMAIAKDGFTFRHWMNHLGQIVSVDSQFSFNMPGDEVKLTAVFNTTHADSNEINIRPQLEIFPNPSTHLVNIKFRHIVGDVTITIATINGLVLNTHTITDVQDQPFTSIDVTTIPSGIYIIEVQNKETILRHKVVISK